MTTSNLPDWPGADTVYRRCNMLNNHKAAEAYAVWTKRKKPRKSDRFTLPEELRDVVKAQDAGDEEFLKAFVAANLDLVFTLEKDRLP